MLHFIGSIILLVVGIYLAIALAGLALKIIGFVLIVGAILWLIGAFRSRGRTTAAR